MNQFYNTRHLTVEQKIQLCREALPFATHWWVDELDCSKSWLRVKIDMPFEEILTHLNQKAHFCVVIRDHANKPYLEVGFSTMNAGKDYFLWLNLNIPEGEKLLAPYGLTLLAPSPVNY
jgi:hypothetical protein